MMPEPKTYYHSPIGLLEIVGDNTGIKSVSFSDEENIQPDDTVSHDEVHAHVQACLQQLDEYFAGQRTEFSVKLAPEGTGFQKKVWQQLLAIPYNKTVSYLDIARVIGDEKAVRAVGHANGQNPIVIIIPCHRVIGSNGKLTGYGGGLWRKEWLLKHEQDVAVGKQMPLL